MEKETIQNTKLGAFGREIRDDVLQIIELSQKDVEQYVQADYEIPEKFLQMNGNSETDKKEKNLSDVIKSGLPQTLGAAIGAGVGTAMHLSSPAVIVCVGAGSMAGMLIQNLQKKEPAETRSLQKEDIKIIRIPNENVLEERKAELLKKAEKINRKLTIHEQSIRNIHDIALDRGFGEWVQKFLVYAEKKEDDRRLQQLRDGLLDRLACMKIHVYEEVFLNENGKPDVPIQDYLIDSRMGEEYTKVIKPAIYSERGILARGEIE